MVVADTIPRYAQPMDVEPVGPFCGECAFYQELTVRMPADGNRHCVGACVYEVFAARDLDDLVAASVSWAEPDDEACGEYRDVL